MKNLGNLVKLLMAGATFFTLASAQGQNQEVQENKNIKEEYIILTKKLSEIEELYKKSVINSYKFLGQSIDEKNIKKYPCYNDSVSFDVDGKKINLAFSFEPWEYVAMVDPTSEKVLSAVSYVDTSGKSNLEIAESVFDVLKHYKFQGIRYEYDPGQNPYILLSLKTFFPGIGYIMKDIINHPDQTLKEKEGDCEDLSILYSSCLLAKGIPCAPVHVNGHEFSLLKVKDSEFDLCDMSKFVVDWEGHAWIPLDITEIGQKDFNRALEKGMNKFHSNHSNFQVLIPEQYKELFGY